MRDRIAASLAATGTLVIVDEADYLNQKSLQCLRQVWDATERQAGIVMVGTHAFLDHLNLRATATERQVLGRIFHVTRAQRVSADDIAAICAPLDLPDDALDEVVRGAAGEARRAAAVVVAAQRQAGEGKITASAIRDAYQTLMPMEVE